MSISINGSAVPSFISPKVFRRYIDLFTKVMDLPQVIHITYPEMGTVDYPVFHKLELTDYNESKNESNKGLIQPKLRITSYAIFNSNAPVPAGMLSDSLTLIDPEIEFNAKSVFWAGAPMQIFKDYMPLNDKKFGSLSWCASYEREQHYPVFYILEHDPVFESVFSLATLELIAAKEEKPRVFVGKVDEEGQFTPASPTKVVGMNTTIGDAPVDIPPANAVPSFLESK